MAFPEIGDLPALGVTTLDGLSTQEKEVIIADTSKICHKLMDRLLGGTSQWRPQPVDNLLRFSLVDWIKLHLEPAMGRVNKIFLLTADEALLYTERVYEGAEFDTKLCLVKALTLMIYLDDVISKDEGMAGLAVMHRIPRGVGPGMPYTKGSSSLRCPHERCGDWWARDKGVSELAQQGYEITLPLDDDWASAPNISHLKSSRKQHLVPNAWPVWLRERTGVTEHL